MKWSELDKFLKSKRFVSETISIDQLLIEQKKCAKGHSLNYVGRTDYAVSLGIGICYRCDAAQVFPEYSQNAGKLLTSLGLGAKKAA